MSSDGTARVHHIGTTALVTAISLGQDGVLSPDGGKVCDHAAGSWAVRAVGSGPAVTLSGSSTMRDTPAVFDEVGGHVAAPAGPGAVAVWNAETGALVGTFKTDDTKLRPVAFSHDASLLLCSASSTRPSHLHGPRERDERVRSALVVSLPDCGVVARIGRYALRVEAESISPDGQRLLTVDVELEHASDGLEVRRLQTVTLRETQTGETVARLPSSEPRDESRFSRDGTLVLTRGEDDLRVWNASDGAERIRLPLPGAASCAEFSFDGTRVIAGHLNAARVWSVSTGALIAVLKGGHGQVRAVAGLGSGYSLTSDDQDVHLWDHTGQHVVAFPGVDRVGRFHVTSSGDRVLLDNWSDHSNRRVLDLSLHGLRRAASRLLVEYPPA